MPKDSRIEYLVYNPTWNPEAGKLIQELHKSAAGYITIDSFVISEKKYYFCPNCGYPCIRSPESKEFSDNGVAAILKHDSRYPSIECSLKVKNLDLGKHFSNEAVRQKAIENETLIVITRWSDSPKGGLLDKAGTYSGIVEDHSSPIEGGTIGRHVGDSYSLISESQSLTRIARNLDRFWTRSILMPEDSQPQHICDLLLHVSQIHSQLKRHSMLFWGRAKDYELNKVQKFQQ
jgi:hypothetical protein